MINILLYLAGLILCFMLSVKTFKLIEKTDKLTNNTMFLISFISCLSWPCLVFMVFIYIYCKLEDNGK
jgi:uncharacterized protein with PQ loop repeat